MTDNDTTKKTVKSAALRLITRGKITKSEAALLSGATKQLVQYWCRNIDEKAARKKYLARLWERATR
jgi:hypothetical protein